jgi:hypothetical protein
MLTKLFFEECVEVLSEVENSQIQSGNFPILLAQNGVVTKKYVSEVELDTYEHFDIADEVKAQHQEIDPGVPVVWDWALGIDAVGITPKVVEQSETETVSE